MFNHRRLTRNALVLLCASAIFASFLVRQPAHAQIPTATAKNTSDRAELYQALLDLTNSWTVMCVAAHPDDEDGTTLTMLRRKYGVHTVSLFSTYGEGGQNAVGPELYQELGVIRARETIAASEIQGSEPYFLGLPDFGYSKSAEETFRVWGEKEALRRMVLKIRQLRPDVIITNHNTVSGHGQHQATGRLILQAFDAASDPNVFPEQLKEVAVWQPQRLFVRFSFEGDPITNSLEEKAEKAGKVITVNPNEKDLVRETTFAEQALSALQRHATQGPWPRSIAERLRAQNRTEVPSIRYRLAREIPSAPALPAEAKNFVQGLRLPLTTGAKLAAPAINEKPLTDFVDSRGEALVALINARRAGVFTAAKDVLQLDPQRFRLMSARLDHALAVASGVTLTLKPNDATLVPGVESQLTATIANSGDADIQVKRLSFSDVGFQRNLDIAEKLPPGTDTTLLVKSKTPKAAAPTVPESEHLYDDRFFGQPLSVNAQLEIEGAPFSLGAETRLPIVPQVQIKSTKPSPYVWTPSTVGGQWSLQLLITNHLATAFQGRIEVSSPDYPHVFATDSIISLEANETRNIKVVDTNPVPPREAGADGLMHPGVFLISIKRRESNELVTQQRLRSVYVDARISDGLRVGYLPSSDETLKNALATLGVAAKELTIEEIQNDDLASYNALIIDNRGYQAHPQLLAANQKLLAYVSEGGTLIVFYHKANEWNPDEKRNRPQLAPYAIVLGDERVTEEDAAVKLLKPDHPLLQSPNRISEADFKGWIQERGLYYPKEWDPHYVALLSTGDKGEPPLAGGLLVARYGKGNYIYTSMVWYRQLMAGVPGGYRMFANMISYK